MDKHIDKHFIAAITLTFLAGASAEHYLGPKYMKANVSNESKAMASFGRSGQISPCAEINSLMEQYNAALQREVKDGFTLPKFVATCESTNGRGTLTFGFEGQAAQVSTPEPGKG